MTEVTNTQKHKHTENKRTDIQTNPQKNQHKDEHTCKHTEEQKHRQTYRRAYKHTQGQTRKTQQWPSTYGVGCGRLLDLSSLGDYKQ